MGVKISLFVPRNGGSWKGKSKPASQICTFLRLFYSFLACIPKLQELIKGVSSISVSMDRSRGPAFRGKGKILPIHQVCLQLLMARVLSGKCLQ